MKHSGFNAIMADAQDMIRRHGFALPPFADWTPEEFSQNAGRARHVIDAHRGSDITDYAVGDLDAVGFLPFTLRNGLPEDQHASSGMCCAEKLLISRQGRLSSMHTHVLKSVDITNRGGATLGVELYRSDDTGAFGDDRGGIRHDNAPGESLTPRPDNGHAFWGEGDDVLIGKTSTANDDETDNIFRDRIGRFSTIAEDTAPGHLLVSNAKTWLAA